MYILLVLFWLLICFPFGQSRSPGFPTVPSLIEPERNEKQSKV